MGCKPHLALFFLLFTSAADGTRFFEVKEIPLANTYPKLPGVTFQKGRDDPAEIQGILSVSATQL